MKFYQLLFLLPAFILSCEDYTAEQKESTKTETVSEKQFVKKDYELYKSKCRQLYKKYKSSPTIENEISFTKYFSDSLLPCWYGTPWNFNGMTEKPGEGSIACGYFVTTTLRDAGIPLQRIKLAQSASQVIIRAVCSKSSIHTYSNVTLLQFTTSVTKMGYGLYIVGLDYHTGLMLNDGQQVWFIHSSYIKPKVVVCEKANESVALNSSHYRIIGKVKLWGN